MPQCSGVTQELEIEEFCIAGGSCPLATIVSAKIPSGTNLHAKYYFNAWGWHQSTKFKLEGDDSAGCLDLIELAFADCEEKIGKD